MTRDDGVQLQVFGSVWEAALELAYFNGWKPAGTEAPEASGWQDRRGSSGDWDTQDYFSHQRQYVGLEDARALAKGVAVALQDMDDGAALQDALPPGLMPSRTSAMAAGLSVTKRNVMCRFVAFANSGGFTIDGA